jgi:hypothetical protein
VREHHVLFGKAVRRDQHGDGLPDGLFGGVSEQFLSAPVPGRDDAVEILADDRIVSDDSTIAASLRVGSGGRIVIGSLEL